MKPMISNRKIQGLSPLAVLALTACGGGNTTVGISDLIAKSKNLYFEKGPLNNLLAFLDYNHNGVLDGGEPSGRTNSLGNVILVPTQDSYTIVGISDSLTQDISTNDFLPGVVLKAPSESTMVTPITTLMEEGNLTATQVTKILGLPVSIDPLTFSAFGNNPSAPANPDQISSLAVEKISHQMMSTLKAFAAAAKGAGATETDAFEAATVSVAAVLKDKADKLLDVSASDSDKNIDFTSAADLALIQGEVTREVAKNNSVDKDAFGRVLANTSTAIEKVNLKISTVTDFSSQASLNIFSTSQGLANQVETAADAESKLAGSGSSTITFIDSAKVDSAAHAGKLYVSGSLVADTTNGAWFDQSLEVYGIDIVTAGAVGGQAAVPDEWALKIAQTIKLLLDPNQIGIDQAAQAQMISTLGGATGTWHEGSETAQRVAKGSGDAYSPNPLKDPTSYAGYESWLDTHSEVDMIWYDIPDSGNTGDGDITEVLEHLMHTIHQFGVRGAVDGSFNALMSNSTDESGKSSFYKTHDLYLAMKQAMDNGVFTPDYGAGNDGLLMQEYTYLLNFSMWEFGKEFWDDDNNGEGSLAGEWADSARTPDDVLANNPLGYQLFNTYFEPVLSKPDIVALRDIFQDNDQGLSGYTPDII